MIHVTMWDVRSVLPTSMGALRSPQLSSAGRKWFNSFTQLGPDEFADKWNSSATMERESARVAWLMNRSGCVGLPVAQSEIDPLNEPTCPNCLRLWELTRVFRDMREERAA